jgi:hypothetical protein
MEKCRLDYKLASLVLALGAATTPALAQNGPVWPGTIMNPSVPSDSIQDSRATLGESARSLRRLPEELTVQISVLEGSARKSVKLVLTPLAIDEIESSECATTGTRNVGFANISATGKEISNSAQGPNADRVFTFNTDFELEANVPFYVREIRNGRVYVEFLGTHRPSVSSFCFRNRQPSENRFPEAKPTFFRMACPTGMGQRMRRGDLILKQTLEIVGHSEIFGFRYSRALDLKIGNLVVAPLHTSDFNQRAQKKNKEICLLQLPAHTFPQVYQNGLISGRLSKIDARSAKDLPPDSVYYEAQCPQ